MIIQYAQSLCCMPFLQIADSDDLKSLAPDIHYRHQPFWQTSHNHEPRQDSLFTFAAICSVPSFRTSGRCLPGQQGGDGVLGLEPYQLVANAVLKEENQPTDNQLILL